MVDSSTPLGATAGLSSANADVPGMGVDWDFFVSSERKRHRAAAVARQRQYERREAAPVAALQANVAEEVIADAVAVADKQEKRWQQQHEDEPPLWQRQQQHEQREAASAAALQAMVAEEVIMRPEARAPSYDYTQMYPLWYRTAYEQGPPVPSPVAWQEALMMYDQQPVEVASAPGF